MAAALGVGTMAGGIGSANIVLAEAQNEETEAADETSEEPADETDSDSSVMKIGALKGPTAMGMAQLLDDENYEFSLAASPDEIVPMIVQGQVDVAAVPSNLRCIAWAASPSGTLLPSRWTESESCLLPAHVQSASGV